MTEPEREREREATRIFLYIPTLRVYINHRRRRRRCHFSNRANAVIKRLHYNEKQGSQQGE